MDDERLKNPTQIFGKDYFEEQLARIRDIRSSERRFYQKITDIYTQCSADYTADNDITKKFFATVQNKLHWAITGQTAAEIIYNRVDSTKENIGLQTWKNAPKGSIRKSDIGIAKNYLNETELDNLNRIVTMYLDYAKMQAKFLKEKTSKETVVYQLFIEPNGEGYMEGDKWKEEFLKDIENKFVIHQSTNYKLVGLPFYNSEPELQREFTLEFDKYI